jgi:hypothetical protein
MHLEIAEKNLLCENMEIGGEVQCQNMQYGYKGNLIVRR